MYYLDYAATTPVPRAVAEAMTAVLTEDFGNPSSQYPYGRPAHALVEDCRIRKAVFDPETGILKLEFDAGEKAEMRLKSSKRVEGKGIEQHPDGTIDVLISKPGEYHLSLRIP